VNTPTAQDNTNTPTAECLNEHQLCPLSFAQERLWFLDQLHPGNPAYSIPQAWRLQGELNLAAFEKALGEVVRRHETLRTTFSRIEGKPAVIIAAFEPMALNVLNFSTQADPEDSVRQALQHAARLPFNLQTGPLFRAHLFRLSSREHIVLFNFHHIIADAWSFEILRREIAAIYSALCNGTNPDLPELPIQYLDYASWQREQWHGQNPNLDFWKQHLAGEPAPLELPYDFNRSSAEDFSAGSESIELSLELTSRLKALAQKENATLFHVLFAAFNTFLHRITGQDSFTIGTPVSGRERVETENLIGFFVNTIALRTDASGNPTFIELLRRVRDVSFSALAHQDIPFEEVVKALQPDRAAGQNPLFQVVFGLHGGYREHWKLGTLDATTIDMQTGTAKFDRTFLLEENGSGVKGRLEYRAALFEAESIRRSLEQFHLLLDGIAQNPERRIAELPLLNEAERQLVLADWNKTTTTYERHATIHQLFEAQAAQTPDAVALIYPNVAMRSSLSLHEERMGRELERGAFDPDSKLTASSPRPSPPASLGREGTPAGWRQMTYRELNERANQLAWRLQKSGLTKGSLVGVSLERSPELIIALLAILKAGGAYVPWDKEYPAERLNFMIQDAGIELLISDSDEENVQQRTSDNELQISRAPSPFEVQHSMFNVRFFPISDKAAWQSEPIENLPANATAESLAYVIYTSGSTGRPKGAAIPHRGVVRLVRSTNYASFSPDEVFLLLAPVSFDASTFEIWGALLNGAKLVLFPPHTPSLEELGRVVEQHQVSTLWLTAGLFHQMVDQQLHSLRSVRQLLAGGDVLSVPHVQNVLRELPDCQLINGYGPTENTTFTCCYRVPANWPGGKSVPIGKPISNTRAYILDEQFQPVPIGVPGELFIAGDGLAVEYLNRPELNREKFISISALDEARLYRTGDRVRWLADGNIEFLGRKDQQVKIRGFRIEAGEIETALVTHPAVQQAAVKAVTTHVGDRQLAAYFTRRTNESIDPALLRTFLESKLPAHMIPLHFVALEKLPLTPNGKVDYRALPSPNPGTASDQPETPPRNETEETLAKIWRDVLGRNSFGVHDNFFQLGGHSLLAIQIISRIARAFQVELPVRAIFEAPTVAGLADKIRTTPKTAKEPGIASRRSQRANAKQLLDRIEELSEAEIESLLSRPN
jgi:amino acid adenylation domain-containing protein